NRTQLFPNLTLKRRRSDVECEIESRLVLLEVVQNLLDGFAQCGIVACDLRFRKLCTQVFLERCIVVAHSHGTHATPGDRDEQTSHRRIDDRVADVYAATAATVSCGCHAEFFRSVLVKTAARVET